MSDSRETLKSFLAHIGSTDNKFTYTRQKDGPDLGIDPGAPEDREDLVDLEANSTGLIGDYLEYLLDNAESGNVFNLKGKNVKATSPNRGNPVRPSESQGAKNVFTKSNSPGGLELNRYSNSGMFDTSAATLGGELGPLSSVVDKKMGTDGHDIYSDINPLAESTVDKTGNLKTNTPDESEHKIPTRTSNYILEENRFSSIGDTHTNDGNLWDQNLGSSQKDLGAYDSGDENSFHYHNIRKVGLSLLLKSAGYDKASRAADSLDPDKFEDLMKEGGFSNNWDTNTSVKCDTLLAKNAAGAEEIFDSEIKRRLDKNGGGSSYGTTYTPYTQFNKVGIGPHIAHAIASLSHLLDLASNAEKSITGRFAELGHADNNKHTLGKGPLFFGTSNTSLNPGFALLKMKLIANVDYDYGDCVRAGMDFLFGDKFSDKSTVSDVIESSPLIWSSPGYIVALSRSISRSSSSVMSAFSELSASSLTQADTMIFLDILKESNIVGIMNALATTGNIVKKIKISNSNSKYASAWSVDDLPDGPATRQAKSRSATGLTVNSLSWRTSATPSMFLLPNNVLYAAVAMGNTFSGQNPTRAHLGSTLAEKTYFGLKAGSGDRVESGDTGIDINGTTPRIPKIVVRRVEDLLESEYVPFYFHDIRTNEIISFHAFISGLTDNITPSYSPVSGYGRVDPIQIYKSTQRSLSFSFYIVATSPEDFDEMWYKINKLTTMVYPQYDQGVQVEAAGKKPHHIFTVPFSQVPTGTPITRVRIGDVIKSNYSKFNLARIFGIGEPNTVIVPKELTHDWLPKEAAQELTKTGNEVSKIMTKVFMMLFGSPIASLYGPDESTNAGARLLASAGTTLLKNGFMNPILELYTNMMRDPDISGNPSPAVNNLSSVLDNLRTGDSGFGYVPLMSGGVLLKPSQEKGYIIHNDKDISRYFTGAHYRGEVMGREKIGDLIDATLELNTRLGTSLSKTLEKNISSTGGNIRTKTVYKILITDLNAPNEFFGETVYATHAELCPDPAGFTRLMMLASDPIGFGMGLVTDVIDKAAMSIGIPGDEVQSALGMFLSPSEMFMNGNPAAEGGSNPITHAFESSMGRGLAGVLDKLTFTWVGNDIPWNTDLWGRAPMVVKVSTGLKVIHDLPPGLAHDGYNRAPIYNVGKIMHEISGDVYDDNGKMAEQEFSTSRRKIARKDK
jgi:hypothetical protein